ncbi:MAG: hypothetical protein LRZ85_09360 [Alphaproteobacteria bacterium]|nr:hypothetical protein [Alphaproteobacteria bacterium]MCD8520422.1 hypothetical protein [Alphaproteobacteria bacterium]
MAETPKSDLDKFADRLHAGPKEGQSMPAYYDELAGMLPGAIGSVKFSQPVAGGVLSTQQKAELIAAISPKLDDKATQVKDDKGNVVGGSASTQQAFLVMLERATDKDRQVPIAALQAQIKQDPDSDGNKDQNFQLMMASARQGLQARPPQPGGHVWTMTDIMGLFKILMTSSPENMMRDIQKFVNDQKKPEVAQPAPSAGKVDLENPTLKAVAALTLEIKEEIITDVNGKRNKYGELTIEGPISHKTYDAITDPEVKAFFDRPDQQRLEVLLDKKLEDPSFIERLKARGIDVANLDAAKAAIRNTILADEQQGQIVPVETPAGMRYLTYTANRSKEETGQIAALDFAGRANLPEFQAAPDLSYNVGTVIDGIALNNQGFSHDYLAGNIAYEMAVAAGYEMNNVERRSIHRVEYTPDATVVFDPKGMPADTESFMKDVHQIVQEKIKGIEANLGDPQLFRTSKITRGEHAGRFAFDVLKEQVEAELKARHNSPDARKEVEAGQKRVAGERKAFEEFPNVNEGAYDPENFDSGAAFYGNPKSTVISDTSIKFGHDDRTSLFLRVDNLRLLMPMVTQDKTGKTLVSLDDSNLSGGQIRDAIKHHLSIGGTVRMNMLGQQDGDAKQNEFSPIGVRIDFLDEHGHKVKSGIIPLGEQGGFDMTQSQDVLKHMTRGINDPEFDHNGAKPEYKNAPQVDVMQIFRPG